MIIHISMHIRHTGSAFAVVIHTPQKTVRSSEGNLIGNVDAIRATKHSCARYSKGWSHNSRYCGKKTTKIARSFSF
jgi:hypothetical protein